MKLSAILDRFGGAVEDERDGWLCRCPAHDDSHASLRVTVGSRTGKVLIACRASCDSEDVLSAVGLSWGDLANVELDGGAKLATSGGHPPTPAHLEALRQRVAGFARALTEDHPAAAYATRRFGVSWEQAQRLELGVTPGPGGERLSIPFRDADGFVTYYQARALDPDAELRWYGPANPEGHSWPRVGCFEHPDPSKVVVVAEGPGDALSAFALGLDAAAIRGSRVLDERGARELARFVGDRRVVVVGDLDAGGEAFDALVRAALGVLGVEVAVVKPPEYLGPKADLSDWRTADPAGALSALLDAAPDPKEEAPVPVEVPRVKGGDGDEKQSQAAVLVDFALASFDFGVSVDGLLYGVPKTGARIARPIGELSPMLRKAFREETGKIVAREAMSAALDTLKAYAADEEPSEVGIRARRIRDRIYLDLGTADGRVVIIDPDGWRVVEAGPELPVFRRSSATRALPEPERGGSLDLLREVLGLEADERAWYLIRGWLVAALFEDIPRPILWSLGSQGSGKTTRTECVLSVIEPTDALGADAGRSERDDTTRALGRFIPSWDNVSNVTSSVSDWLCRLVTGVEVGRRTLYTDDELRTATLMRTAVTTSITLPVGLGPDALERLTVVEYGRIPDTSRLPVADLKHELKRRHPAILGALLDLVVAVLRELPTARPESLPRMADYARILWALDSALGLAERPHFEHYVARVNESLADRVHDDAFLVAVLALMDSTGGTWEGTASELLAGAADHASIDATRSAWPRTPRGAADALRRASESLRHAGVAYEPPRKTSRTQADGSVKTVRPLTLRRL